MRIFFLITKSEQGGAQTHISQLVKEFIHEGHDVAVMAYPGGWLEHEVRSLGAHFIPNVYFQNSYNIFRFFHLRSAILKALHSFRPDIISCHSGFAGFFTRLVVRRKIPTIFTAHGWSFSDGVVWYQKILTRVAEKIVSRWADKIICVSDYDRNLALRYRIADQQKMITIHNGVEMFSLEKSQVVDSQYALVFIGRLAFPKRPELLVQAISLLPFPVLEKIKVYFLGDGPRRKELENDIQQFGVSKYCSVQGNVSRDEVISYLHKSHIGILLSWHEGFPCSVLEMMSAGLPVIASAVGGVPEMVNKTTGILIESDDGPAELAQNIMQLIQDSDMREQLGRHGRERVEAEFRLDHMCHKTFGVYQDVLAQRI